MDQQEYNSRKQDIQDRAGIPPIAGLGFAGIVLLFGLLFVIVAADRAGMTTLVNCLSLAGDRDRRPLHRGSDSLCG